MSGMCERGLSARVKMIEVGLESNFQWRVEWNIV